MDDISRIWKPLDSSRREIRLLILAPNRDPSALPRGRLITVSLEQQLYYDAVSHAWGGPSDPYYIHINDSEWPVTTGILMALQRLRHPIQEKSFWIDALCVNQYDIKERAEQVKLMQYIFHRAVNVQAWLGHSPLSVERIIDAINDDIRLQQLFTTRNQGSHLESGGDEIGAFLSLEYWRRTWVIQELALARNVIFVFGSKTFTMGRLRKLNKAVWDQEAPLSGFDRDHALRTTYTIASAGELFRVATMGSREQKTARLVEMLAHTRQLECYDARDRIYGMIGLMTAMFGPGFIDADYECSLSDVYTRFAGRLIDETGLLTIVNQAESICPRGGLPTWVPDWTSRYSCHNAFQRLQYMSDFHAAGEFSTNPEALAPKCMLTLTPPSSLLKCWGHIIGRVQVAGTYCISYFTSLGIGTDPKKVIEGWRGIYSGPTALFVRTITLSRRDQASDLAECYNAGRQTSWPERKAIRDACQDAISDRRFFVTNNNAPGLGPRNTRLGDFLAVLAGGRAAYVLRPSSNPSALANTYSLVGECFVDGVMLGELFEGGSRPEFSEIYIE